MRKIDGDELDGILLREYEKHMKRCRDDLEVGALMMAECELHRAHERRTLPELDRAREVKPRIGKKKRSGVRSAGASESKEKARTPFPLHVKHITMQRKNASIKRARTAR